IQVLRARKRMLVAEVGADRAEAVLSKLPPPDIKPGIHALLPDTPTAGASRHQRKGSSASSRKKSRDMT
ncbi:hypothetical protein H4R23_003804, partial [Coemansia sp. Cherry 401B]